MAGERLTARFSLHSQVWSRLTGKCFETATSHIQTVVTNKKEMNKTKYIFIFILAILLCGCSATYKMNRGKVIPSDFNAKINITTTAKGVMLIPCEYEEKNKKKAKGKKRLFHRVNLKDKRALLPTVLVLECH